MDLMFENTKQSMAKTKFDLISINFNLSTFYSLRTIASAKAFIRGLDYISESHFLVYGVALSKQREGRYLGKNENLC